MKLCLSFDICKLLKSLAKAFWLTFADLKIPLSIKRKFGHSAFKDILRLLNIVDVDLEKILLKKWSNSLKSQSYNGLGRGLNFKETAGIVMVGKNLCPFFKMHCYYQINKLRSWSHSKGYQNPKLLLPYIEEKISQSA